MKNVLITGASGALGRAVVSRLEELCKYQVFVASRHCLDRKTNIICDILDKNQIIAAIDQSQPDIILHLAATLSNDLDEAYAVNVEPARHILDMIQSKSLKTRVLLIGSAAEYGIVKPSENPISEDHVLAPISAYGISKAWQTQLMSKYAMGGVDVLCARVFNLYGEGISAQLFPGNLAKQINEVLNERRDAIEVGDLSAIRDYISTEDAAEKLLAILLGGQTGKIYNVGSGTPIRMREFAINQLKKYGLNSSILKEVSYTSEKKGTEVPVIFADMRNTNHLK